MEISIPETEDQQADNNENSAQIDSSGPAGCGKEDSNVIICKNVKSHIENVTNPMDNSEKSVEKQILDAESSKVEDAVSEAPINNDLSQVSKLELDRHESKLKTEHNLEKAKEDPCQAKVKADSIKIKIKVDVNQAKGKMDANQVKGKTYQSKDKIPTDQDKTKSTGELNKAKLHSAAVSDANQSKLKLTDQSSSKVKQDQNQTKTKLDQIKSPVKLNPFQIRAAAFEDDSKLKVETIPKESGKGKKKFYFLFRVKEFNVIAVKKDDLKYKCHVCNGIYRQKFSLKRHFLRNHINPDYISFADISNCKINVPNEKIMQQVAEETKTPSGRKRFKTKDAIFLEGNKSRLMPGLYKCHECSEIKLDLESELKAHYVSHPNVQTEENFPCDHCSAVFQKRAVLNKHVTAHHEKKSAFTCKKCKLEFPSDADLQKHTSSYVSGGKCKYCEKGFCTAAMRKKHESIHEGMKGYSCKHCHDIFSKVDDVKKHVVKVHASLYLTCPHCPKQAFPHMFATEALLSIHVREKHDRGRKITSYFGTENKIVNGKDKTAKVSTSAESVCNYCQKKFPGVRAMFKHKTIAHKKLLHKHKTAAHKKNVLAKKQSNMAAKQKAYNKKIANEKKIQQKKIADKNKVLQKERTTYERKAKQAVQDKSVAERFSTRRIKMESSRIAMSKFYANLSQNIAENLLEHVDGRAHQLSIKEYNFSDNNEFLDHRSHHDQDQIPWSSYNFPLDFDVRLALDKRGHEIKPKEPVNEHCLFATGLEKVNHAKETIDTSNKGVINLNAKDEINEVYDTATLRTLSLEEKKQLLRYDPIVVYICNICKQSCNSFREIDDHSHNNHPNVEASWVEIEGTKNLPPLIPVDLCRQPFTSPDGVLFSCAVPPLMPDICTLKCTKCKHLFQKSSDLHQHLLECGGNESFRPKYHKKINMQKRIKHTMKHRMDLSVKQVASKKESPYKNNHLLKNGLLDKAKVKYGKDYFSTNGGKSVKPQSPLTFQQKNITCFFCKEKFETKMLLTKHYNVCSKFNRKKRGKAFSPNSKKHLNKAINEPKKVSHSEIQLVSNVNPTSNLPKSHENGLDLTVASSEKSSATNFFSDAQRSLSAPIPTNKSVNLSTSANHESFAMDLSVKAVKPTDVPKLNIPNRLENSKTISKEKTPIEALHETVQRIEANRTRQGPANLSIGTNSSPQRSQKPASPSEVAINKNLVSPKSVALKPTVPNPRENLPKIKEVINEIKRAANSPNHKKSVAPLMFIVSNPDKNAMKNFNSTISTIENKLKEQISSTPSNQLKEQPFVARRKRKKGQPTKIVQKTDDNVIASTNSNSQKDNLLMSKSTDMNQAVTSQPLIETGDCSSHQTEEINKSMKNLLKEMKLTPVHNVKATADNTNNLLPNPTLKQANVTPVVPPVSCNSTISKIPDPSFTSNKQDKVTTELFVSNEKAPVQFNPSEDRESPTLELLVNSVTQNIKNFDKPSFLDDEKFALPSLNINSAIPLRDDKAIASARNSLNFRVIIPDAESSTNSLLGSDDPQIVGAELSKIPIIDSAISNSNCSKKSKELASTSVIESTEFSEITNLDKVKMALQLTDNQYDRPIPNSGTNVSVFEKSSTSLSPSSKSQERILVDEDRPSKEVDQNDSFSNSKADIDKILISSSDEKTSEAVIENNNASDTAELSSDTVPAADDLVPKQRSANLEQIDANDSATCNTEASQKPSIDNISKQITEQKPVPYDSIESTFAAVLKGGSWRRGRRPSKRGVGRNRTVNRNVHSTDPEKLNLSINSALSPIPKKGKISKTKQRSSTSNVSSQLRAFRIENSEVSSDFVKGLASRMKERMRLSFGPVSVSDSNSEASTKTLDESQIDPSALVTSSKSSETNYAVNSSVHNLTLEPDMEASTETCHERVALIKKEYKEPELSKRHICPYCILEFAYLTNFRRHLKVCKSKHADSVDETPSSSASTSQIQHLPKKEEVEESMLNLLRHQSRQNQMIKETQPVKAFSDSEKNFQKFNCENCHKIYFSLFKLMQHRMKVHLMPSSGTKAMVSEDQPASELDEDSQGSVGSSVRENAEPISLLNLPAEDVPSSLLFSDSQDPSGFDIEDNLEVDGMNSLGNEGSLKVTDQNELLGDATQINSTITNMPIDALNIQANDSDSKVQSISDNPPVKAVEAATSANKHSNKSSNKPVKEKSSFLQKKYREVIDPNYFGIPYARGRGRKKKSEVQSGEKKTENVDKVDTGDNVSLNVSESTDKSKHIPKTTEENLKDTKSVSDIPKASSSNELQSKRDIYLTILTNCKKVSVAKSTPAKDSSKVKEISMNDASIITNVSQHNMSHLTSPVIVKKRGRPRLSTNIKEKNEVPGISTSEINVNVYTLSSEKNGKEIAVTKETNPQNLSPSTTGSIPKKRGRKRAVVESIPTAKFPKLKRGKYIRVKKIPTFTPETSEFETDDSASFIVSGDEVIPSPNQLTKIQSPKARTGAKSLDIPQIKGLKGRQSAITKLVPGSPLNKATKASKSLKTVSPSMARPAVESSPSSNFLGSKAKTVKNFAKAACDTSGPSTFTKGTPKNSKQLKLHLDSSPDDASDFQISSFGKRVHNKICPICKKKFSASLLRNRHVQLVHGRKNSRMEAEFPSDLKGEQKQTSASESRPKFQRHCIKPLPPLKRKYQKTMNSIAQLKKQKL